MDNQVNLMNETPVDGCLVLGRKGPTFSAYNTRYYVDRKAQRHDMSRTVVLDDCSPCCKYNNQSAISRALWSVLHSESFLLFLHALVLIIGLTKEALDLRITYPTLHFNQSVMEMFVACVQMSLRAFFLWSEFRAMKKTLVDMDVSYIEGDISFRGKRLHKYVTIYISGVGAMILTNFITFGIFYVCLNLGWTLLTNNLFMLICASTASVLKYRFTVVKFRMKEDEHKVALLETVLLLRESFLLRGEEEKADYLNRVERFLTAFKNTPYFHKPDHIHVLSAYVPDWDLYESGEQITVV